MADGAQITQRRVPAPGIVKPLDLIEHVGPGLVSVVIRPVGAFDFERREKALHRRTRRQQNASLSVLSAMNLDDRAASDHRQAQRPRA